MNKRHLLTLLYICIFQYTQAQTQLVQNIKGQVTEQATGLPLIGANIFILDSDPAIGTSTDINGYYKFENMPVGRYRLGCSYVGYKSTSTGSLLITTGKEFVQDFSLEEDFYSIDIEVTAVQEQNVQASEISTVSVQVFNSEQATRFAGSRSDVARMAAGFAGVSANDDSRNDIIIRGNSPSGLLWRMNGIDIPNPSHFGALGATGGPVSMLNNNLLANSIFMTGAFPAVYGNALSGVFDLSLRKGNKDKIEGLFGISFNGFEAGLEGPLGKKGGSFFVNYRYSVIDLISKLGGNSGDGTGTGDAIPRYQDLSFHLNLPTTKLGTFSLFGIAGKSGIDFLVDPESSGSQNLFSDSNQNLYYKSNMQVYGLTNKHYFNNHSYGKLSLSYSTAGTNIEVDTLNPSFEATPVYRDNSNQDRLALAYYYKNKITKKHSLILGATINQLNFNFIDSTRADINSFRTLRDFEGNSILTQSYAQWQYKHNDRLTLNLGAFGQQFSLNNTGVIEPRFNLKYDFNPKVSMSFGLGRHSKLQDYQLYVVKTQLQDGSYIETNKDLDLTKSDQAVIGVNWAFAKKWSVKSEVYYQSLSDIPVEIKSSNFSAINLGADFNVPDQDSLINEGTGQNLGFELTLERTFSEGFYLMTTLSVFKSTFKGSDGVSHSTAFDNGYIANVLTGKEFKFNDKYSISIDTKITLAGGRRYTPINLDASIAAGDEVLNTSSAFNKQFDDYFRTDLKLSFRQNLKRLSQSWSVDLQNLFNNENVFGQSYNQRTEEINITNQLGFYPVIEYRLEF